MDGSRRATPPGRPPSLADLFVGRPALLLAFRADISHHSTVTTTFKRFLVTWGRFTALIAVEVVGARYFIQKGSKATWTWDFVWGWSGSQSTNFGDRGSSTSRQLQRVRDLRTRRRGPSYLVDSISSRKTGETESIRSGIGFKDGPKTLSIYNIM